MPLNSVLLATGAPQTVFADSASATFGLTLADSEAACIRWNNNATPGTALTQIGLPPDLDDAEDAYLEFVCSKTGATVGDATTLTLAVYIFAVGNLHDADANCGGVTNALTGNAVAKTTAALRRKITAADIPLGARTMTVSITPTAGTLGTDDLLLHDIRLLYKRKAATLPGALG